MAAPSKRLGPEFEKAQQSHELERYKSILRNPSANAAAKKMAQQRIDEGTQREAGEGGQGSGPRSRGSLDSRINGVVKSIGSTSDPAGKKVLARHLDTLRDEMLDTIGNELSNDKTHEAGAEEPFTPPDSGTRPEGYVDPRYTSLKQPVVKEAKRGWTSPGVYIPPTIKQESAKINIKEF